MGKSMPMATFEGDVMGFDDLRAIDIFSDVDEKSVNKFPGTVRRRVFKAGSVVCRQGEGGTTAFYIEKGRCRVFIARSGGDGGRSSGGVMAKIGRLFGQKTVAATPAHRPDDLVPIDASIDLTYGKLTAELVEGSVFGEMSCLDLAPRSATVIAETDCVMIEVLRNMYEVLLRTKSFKERMDAIYRQRALDAHLRSTWLFKGLPDDVLAKLGAAAELQSIPAGTTIFDEHDESDSMYLIRRGQVRVSKQFPGGDRRLAYLTKGDCIGEIGLLKNDKRTATCVAADHPIQVGGGRKRRPANVELVKISREAFEEVIGGIPELRTRLELMAEKRLLEQLEAQVRLTPTAHSEAVEGLGLLQGQNLMLIDLEKCTRCDQCAQACAAAHDDGASRLIREGPRFDRYLVPASCRMCRDPVCMIGCPVGSIRKGRDLNIVIEDWCVGCGVCSKQCPYNSIQMHSIENLDIRVDPSARRIAQGEVAEVTERAVVCDQCSELLSGPACVYACPHDAALRVDALQFLGAEEQQHA